MAAFLQLVNKSANILSLNFFVVCYFYNKYPESLNEVRFRFDGDSGRVREIGKCNSIKFIFVVMPNEEVEMFRQVKSPSRPEFPLKVREIIWDSRAATEVEAEIFQLRF